MSAKQSTFADYFHQQTKYTLEGITKNSNSRLEDLKLQTPPEPFREFVDAEQIDLSAYVPLNTNPFSDTPIVKSANWTIEEKDLAELSRILYFANGVTAIIPYPPVPLLMRAAPSAGALYPNEIYVALKQQIGSAEPGLYNFQVKTQSLAKMQTKPNVWTEIESACFNHPAMVNANICLIVTGVFYRSVWRYQDRAYRRILLDAGHILSNIQMVSYLYKKKAFILGGFNDQAINQALQLDQDEQVLTVIPLLDNQDLPTIDLEQYPLALPSPVHQTIPEIPTGALTEAMHEFSSLSSSDYSIKPKERFQTNELSTNQLLPSFLESQALDNKELIDWDKKSLLKSIMQRRSCRKYDQDKSISLKELSQVLQFSYLPQSYDSEVFDHEHCLFAAQHIKSYLIINNVEGLESGGYIYSPQDQQFKQIRFKELRDESFNLCLNQELGHDAAVLLIHVASDLDKLVELYGERIYRYLHLDAGNIGQKVNLAATHLGFGASGIGGFFDDLVNETLGIAAEDIVLYITTLGHPLKESFSN